MYDVVIDGFIIITPGVLAHHCHHHQCLLFIYLSLLGINLDQLLSACLVSPSVPWSTQPLSTHLQIACVLSLPWQAAHVASSEMRKIEKGTMRTRPLS